MRVLVMVHVESEGPGTLGTYLESVGAELVTARLYAGDALPSDPSWFDALISMGGPMNVYEEDKYPYLREETAFLDKAIHADVPVLGVCLGSQMIAKASGARVDLSVAPEIGWGQITLRETARTDGLFQGLPDTLDVLQWHSDMFHVPDGGVLLASSTICPNQAFRYRNAFGLQFHVEVTAEILAEWFEGSQECNVDDILERYHAIQPQLDEHAHLMYRNFVSVIQGR